MTCTTLDKGSFRVLSLHKNFKAMETQNKII